MVIVTRCMGRQAHLERTLRTWLCIPSFNEIIIVNWGNTEDLSSFVGLDKRITILNVENKKYFDRGAAWNVGIKYAPNDFIFALDCDIEVLSEKVFEGINFEAQNRYYRAYDSPFAGPALYGTVLFRKKDWEKTSGYIENLPTWGSEDFFFFKALVANNVQENFLQKRFLRHIDHDDRWRFKNHSIQEEALIEATFHGDPRNDLRGLKSDVQRLACRYNDEFIERHGISPMGEHQVGVLTHKGEITRII